MQIVFCGSGEVAVPSLRAVHAAGHEILAVVTQPARQAGRGGKVRPTPVDVEAESLGLPVIRTTNINAAEMVERLAAMSPDLEVVVDFGQKVGAEVRNLARHGAFNMHASLLPKLRGAAPINWAIMRGFSSTGVSTFVLVDKMDAGPILLQREVEILPEETAEELRVRLAEHGAGLVVETVAAIEQGTVTPREQDHSQATLAPKLSKLDGRIDFKEQALAVANRIRGVWPWPGAYADFARGGGASVRVIFTRARAVLTAEPESLPPGTVGDDLSVACGGGRIEVLELKVAGKRLMGWKDFVNGYRVAAGDVFRQAQESDNG